MLISAVLYVATGVGGCWCPIYTKAVHMGVALCKFSNKPLNYASLDDAITFLIMLHSTRTGPFSGGISYIGVLDFGPKKKYPPDLLRASGFYM